jgi:hypothetical protein
MMKNKDETSTQSHGRTKRDSCSYEVLQHGNQMENKVLNRMPMEQRIYHINYDTVINKEC